MVVSLKSICHPKIDRGWKPLQPSLNSPIPESGILLSVLCPQTSDIRPQTSDLCPQPSDIRLLSSHTSGVHARPFRLKKNLSPFCTFSENIFGEKTLPVTRLLISPSVG